MDNILTKYALHLDDIRRSSKIKVSEFCNGICSDRQYRRYLNGEQTITQNNIMLFSDKLGLRPSDFYTSYYTKDIYESQKIYQVYRDIWDYKFDDAKDNLDKLDKHEFRDVQAKNLYGYCKIVINHHFKKITMLQAYDQYKELIDYSSYLDKKIFNFVDIITIHKIAYIEYDLDKEEAMLFLYKILFNKEFVYVSSHSRHILPSTYAGLSKLLGMRGRIKEALAIAEKGIEYSVKIADMSALAHLYYYKSFSLFKFGKINESLLFAKKCIATTIARENKNDYDTFMRIIKKDYDINPEDLFLKGFIK